MKNKVLFFLLLGPFCSAFGPGSVGSDFLRLPQGARAIAMGEAYTSLAFDASSIYWNPGCLVYSGNNAFFMHSKYLAGINYNSLAATKGMGKEQAMGISIFYLSTEDTRRDENGKKLGKFSNYDVSLETAYGMRLNPSISIGMGIKNIHRKLDDKSATGCAFDFGFLHKERNFNLGLCLKNLSFGEGTKFIKEYDPYPFQFSGGIAYANPPFKCALDFVKPEESDYYLNLGLECLLFDKFFIRGGVPRINKSIYEYSYGFGFKTLNFNLDFALISCDKLGNPFYFSLSFNY
ncbi:MAG: PorV/PorQ family protein [bacterium]